MTIPTPINNKMQIQGFEALIQAINNHSPSTAASIGQILWGQTQAEAGAGVTPTNYAYAPGNVLRYGTNTTPGTTDMTAAIQAAVDVMLAGGANVWIPTGTYLISSAITLTAMQGWTIKGAGWNQSRIIQATDNTPIFHFTGCLNHGWIIDGVWLDYTNSQASNSLGMAIAFEGDDTFAQSIAYNYTLSNIRCDKARQLAGVVSDGATLRGIWGGTHLKIYASTHGGVVDYGANSLYQRAGPNMFFRDVYVVASDNSLPIFAISGGQGEFHTIEVNLNDNGVTYIDLKGGSFFKASHLVMENAAYSGANCAVFTLTDCLLDIDYLHLFGNSFTWAPGGGNAAYIFRYTGGGTSAANVKCRYLDLVNFSGGTTAVSSGTLYVHNITQGSAQPSRVEINDLRGLVGLSNAYLTNMGSTASANITNVTGWQLPAWSADAGDANTTVTVGSTATNIRYDTTLTAARKVILPNGSANNNCFSGLTYRVSRTAGGAFDLTVEDVAGNVFATIASGTTGTVEVTFIRTGVNATSWRSMAAP